MNSILQEHLVSALQTFLATFFAVLGTTLSQAGTLEFTTAFWASLLMASVRAGVKEVFAHLAPVALGGRR